MWQSLGFLYLLTLPPCKYSLSLTDTDKHTAGPVYPCNLPLYYYCSDGSTSNYNCCLCSVLHGTLCMLFYFKYLTLLRFAAHVIRGVLEYKALIDA